MSHPIEVTVHEGLERNRLTSFFRPILAIPHFIWLALWGIAVVFALIISWFATLFSGTTPDSLHGFIARYVRYSTQVTGYAALLADPYPGFLGSSDYPVDVAVAPPAPQNRWITGFRVFVAIPALIIAQVLQDVLTVLIIFSWFVILVTGAQHAGLRNISAWIVRFQAQTLGYVGLLTDRYPEIDIEAPAVSTPQPA